MSIKPLDLQVNLSQMNHVSKEQAALKNSELNRQLVKGLELFKENQEADTKVSSIATDEEGVTQLRDDEERRKESEAKEKKKHALADKKKKSEDIRDKKKNLFNDLSSGWHIDITG